MKLRAWIHPGDALVVALVLLPLAAAWPRLVPWFGGNAASVLNALARATGILALSTFLVAALLSVRLPKLDKIFGGLTRLWHLHHGLGLACFVLTMAHVVFFALAGLLVSRRAAMPAIFPPLSETAIWAGWFAFAAMFAFLAPSFKFFGEPHYQRWKRLHLISAAALVLALAHAMPLARERAAWWFLAVLGAGAILWRKALSLAVARRAYVVAEAKPLASDVVELSLRPEGKPLRYDAGQFFYLAPHDPALAAGRGEEHPYTASSSPHEAALRIGIKALGDATCALQSIAVGTRISVEGPYGDFFRRLFPERGQLWLGGGIGITPFVGAARALHHAGGAPTGGAHLFYLADSPERAYYLDELRAAAEGVAGFAMTPHYFTAQGPVTEAFLAKYCPDFAEREIYICGPPPMLAHLKAIFKRMGIPRARIHKEEFNLL